MNVQYQQAEIMTGANDECSIKSQKVGWVSHLQDFYPGFEWTMIMSPTKKMLKVLDIACLSWHKATVDFILLLNF